MRAVAVDFPTGAVVAHDVVVAVLPPKTIIAKARLLGKCQGEDPLALVIAQVRVSRGDWERNLLGDPRAFPLDRGFQLEFPDMPGNDLRLVSTVEFPIRVAVRVARSYAGEVPPAPITFDLALLCHWNWKDVK